MKIEFIRHSTIKIRMNHINLLVDPMLSRKGELDPVANAANSLRNPLVDLPVPIHEIIKEIDAVILTHTHRDHFDDTAIQALSKNVPIFCQPGDEKKLAALGFSNVTKIVNEVNWKGVQFTRTGGQHGTGELGKQMGPVSGFILKAEGEPCLYIAGDSIWCKEVENTILEHSPDHILLNGGEAQFLSGDPITMGIKDIENVILKAPASKIIVVHMEAWNHCLLSREELRLYIDKKGYTNVTVPLNGEIVVC
jgi:L-ascorbate metabolism protein UlaG (beta-lactamase superfamily)